MPDVNNGVHDMLIHCDHSEGVPVGDTISELLCIVPIDKEQGEGEIYEVRDILILSTSK